MKKSFVLLFFFLLLSCSNEGFESKIAAPPQKDLVLCLIKVEGEDKCVQISKSLCDEMAGTKGKCNLIIDVSSSSADVSSSSDFDGGSSSSDVVVGGSSSSGGVVGGSSSGGVVGGSSSGGVVGGSSSSDVVVVGSSSSDVVVGSSSSGGVVGVSSSSDGEISSSSIGNVSSSGGTVSSSSSVGVSSSSSLGLPSLGECSFPYYVAKTKKEYIKNLVSVVDDFGRCKGVKYTLTQTGGGPGAGNFASITGDSISFATSSSSGQRTLNITARDTCSIISGTTTTTIPLSKSCQISVYLAEDYRDARCNHENIFPVNLAITKTPTVIDYACCEPKSDYRITQCGSANFTLSIDGTVAVTSSDNTAVLPDRKLTLIEEPNVQCTNYGDSPGGKLYRYPKRMLMTVTNVLPNGGFSCNSW